VIEQQMEETRSSLTEKVAALETQVVGTVQTATQAVQDTVSTVKSAVQETVSAVKDSVQESVAAVKDTVQGSVDAVKENVKETFDMKRHVQENPYLMIGGAAVAGLITGLLVFRKDEDRVATNMAASGGGAPLSYPPDFTGAPVRERVPAEPGFFDELLGMAGGEAKELAREAVNQAAAAVRQHLMPAVMKWMTENMERAMERTSATASPWEGQQRSFARR